MAAERKSIQEANAMLEEKLKILQGSRESEVLEAAAGKINMLLYEAILQHPSEVNAVRIPVSVSLHRNETGLPDAGTRYSGRYKLERFLRSALGTEEIPECVPFEFVKHLPYEFTTGTHGSGERNAMEYSCPNIAAETGVFLDDVPAYLMIDLSDIGWLWHEKGYLFPDEIKSISLEHVPDEQFTPMVVMGKDREYSLKKTPGSAMHYLYFRGFKGSAIKEKDIPSKRWKKDVSAIVLRTLIPEMSTQLFTTRWGLRNPAAFSGFAADVHGEEPVLYEFDNVSIPWSLRPSCAFGINAIMAAYAIIQQRNKPGSNIKSYTGAEIIRRLAQFEMRREF